MESRWNKVWGVSARLVAREVDSLLRCRECDDRVRLFEQTCPHCGAADATRVPVAASAAMLGTPVVLGMLYFGVRWAF